MITLLEVRFGSQVYGTNTPESDTDIGRVLLEPKEFIFGIQNLDVRSNTIAQTVEGDIDTREMYLRRFIKLCAQGNPNVIEWLYTPIHHIKLADSAFIRHFWPHRDILLNKKKLVDAHMGFAHSQVIKMRKHESKMGAKRRALYAKYGYDVKFASHAVRLMFQLCDIMSHGVIKLPYSSDQRDVLRQIKAGTWSLDRFDEYYNDVKLITEGLIENCDMSSNTDYNKIATLLEKFYMEIYYGR